MLNLWTKRHLNFSDGNEAYLMAYPVHVRRAFAVTDYYSFLNEDELDDRSTFMIMRAFPNSEALSLPMKLGSGLPLGKDGRPRIPSSSQQRKRGKRAGAPLPEGLFVLTVLTAPRRRLISARDLIIDSIPILTWRRADPDAAFGHVSAQHPRPLLRGYRVHTLICRGSGLPLFFLPSPVNVHGAPFSRPLLAWVVCLYQIRPRFIRLDAAYWGLRLITWIHATLGAVVVIPWNSKRQKNRSCLPPSWTREELGKRSGIERFFVRVFLFFRLHVLPSLAGLPWFGGLL